jgi:hypothetical protein
MLAPRLPLMLALMLLLGAMPAALAYGGYHHGYGYGQGYGYGVPVARPCPQPTWGGGGWHGVTPLYNGPGAWVQQAAPVIVQPAFVQPPTSAAGLYYQNVPRNIPTQNLPNSGGGSYYRFRPQQP